MVVQVIPKDKIAKIKVYYNRNAAKTMAQIQKVMKEALDIRESDHALKGYCDDAERALDEAKAAINKILNGSEDIELQPQNQHIRKLQHELVEQHNLASKSVPPVVLSPFIAIAIPTPIITLPKIDASNISEVSGVQEAPTFSISERDNILSNVLNEYLTPSIFIDTKKSGIFNTSETTNTGIPKI